jgi:rod shape-determining protein MreD
MTASPRRIIGESLLTLVIVLLQTTMGRFLSIAGIPPDLALVWIVLIAIRHGQFSGTLVGFSTGLLIDLLSGSESMIGLAALAKTLAGFTAGYFYNENKTEQTLGSPRFLVILGLSATVHQVLYFLIFLQGSGIGVWRSIFLYGIPAALYAVAVGLIPMFITSRKLSV